MSQVHAFEKYAIIIQTTKLDCRTINFNYVQARYKGESTVIGNLPRMGMPVVIFHNCASMADVIVMELQLWILSATIYSISQLLPIIQLVEEELDLG